MLGHSMLWGDYRARSLWKGDGDTYAEGVVLDMAAGSLKLKKILASETAEGRTGEDWT